MLYGTAELHPADDKASEAMRWRIIRHYHKREEDARSYYESVRDRPARASRARAQAWS